MKKAICSYGKLLYDRGMLAGTDGNISVRLDDERILITPSGVAKGGKKDEQRCGTDSLAANDCGWLDETWREKADDQTPSVQKGKILSNLQIGVKSLGDYYKMGTKPNRIIDRKEFSNDLFKEAQ